MESLIIKETELLKNEQLVVRDKQFDLIMMIYQKALENMQIKLNELKQFINAKCSYEVVNNITARLKTPESIIKKMKSKKYDMTYQDMIQNINDIAGLRIICSYKEDIYKIRNIIRQMNDVKILKEKDYIKKNKKSGYSAYHMIIEVPVEIENEVVFIKIEIQIRTMLMDFWASAEHKIKYKPSKKVSKMDSIRLSAYARIINYIGDRMEKMRTNK